MACNVHFLFGDYALDIDRRELKRGADFDWTTSLRLAGLPGTEPRARGQQGRSAAGSLGRADRIRVTSHINAVRKAVGDSGDEQHLIRTVACKGFRFIGEVREGQVSGIRH